MLTEVEQKKLYRNNFCGIFTHCKYVTANIAFIRRNIEIGMVPYTSKSFFFFSEKFCDTTLVTSISSVPSFLDFSKGESSMYKTPKLGPKLHLVFKYILLWDIAHVLLPLYFTIHTDHLSFSFSWVMRNYLHLSGFRRTAVIICKMPASSLYLPLKIIGIGNTTWWTTRQSVKCNFSLHVLQGAACSWNTGYKFPLSTSNKHVNGSRHSE